MTATSKPGADRTRKDANTSDPNSALLPLWRHPAFLITLAAFGVLVLSVDFWLRPLEALIYDAEFLLAEWFAPDENASASFLQILLLPLLGFGGGLLASISPCVLPMVPLNLAYIGAHEASGWKAAALSLRFSMGAAAALSVLGLFGDVAGFLLIEQRGFVLLLAGLALTYFGLMVVEIAPDPIGGHDFAGSRRLGPFGAGAAFSVVTTPCTSPILGAVLVAIAANPTPGIGIATLVAFSFGYTLLVFLGGVFGGGLVAAAKQMNFAAPRAAAAGLLVASGLTFAWTGLAWF